MMKKEKSLITRIVDIYLASPLFFDSIIVLVVWILSKYINFFYFDLISKSDQLEITSNIIGTNVSLAGFILAALTIIVTFKSNLKAKGIKDAESPLELILSSGHYANIVSVFKKSIIGFTVCFSILYIAWLSADNLSIWTINRFVVSGIIVTILTTGRSLLVLFTILDMDKN